jgi:hypothetical protein
MSNRGKSKYRIGTVVLHENGNDLDIVDGQQRLITLTLIIHALINNKKEIQELKKFAAYKPGLTTIGFTNIISKSNIQKNYSEIKRRINDFDEKSISFLFRNCEFVVITLSDLSEAFQFFDSQNSRGKELEPHDLLKAFHLREMEDISETETADIVAAWESIETKELSGIFSDYLFKIRNWSKGKPALYFTKDDIDVFKGINVKEAKHPFEQIFRIANFYVDDYNSHYHRSIDTNKINYPFQIDQAIINGRRFFEMIAYYREGITKITNNQSGNPVIKDILDNEKMWQKRARNTKSLFDCALIYFIDKFGDKNIPKAVEKIFIWAYSLRLQRQKPQNVTFDNFARGRVDNIRNNIKMFQLIREAINEIDIINMKLDSVENINDKVRADKIIQMFKDRGYYDGK